MNRRSAIRKLAIAGAASFDLLLRGQEGPGFTIRAESSLVVLDVSVRDSRGAAVTGLPKQSFQVIEDGVPQPITVFDNKDIPVTVGLIVDESRSMTPKRGEVLVAAEVFVQESNPHDQIFVINFNDEIHWGLPSHEQFSDSVKELQSALYRGTPEGKTALNDAVIAGLQQLELGRREKKTLVVISDGGDNASRHNTREMLEAVERSVATIYTIGVFDEDDPDRNPGILKHLAAISGGFAYFPPAPDDTIPICRKIAKEIRSRYTVGYVPMPDNGKRPLRHVQIRVSAPGHGRLHVRARGTYRYGETQ